MKSGRVVAHSTFRNQPSFKIFNKSFEDPKDALYLQLNEIDPFFLAEERLQDNGFSQDDEPIDPRTKKRVDYHTYNYTQDGKSCWLFHGAGLKSTLTKNQQDTCLRVLQRWQERQSIDEDDLIVWRQSEGKIRKERVQMQAFINEYATTHKDDMYAPTKRLDELYRRWFKRKTYMLLQKYPQNLTYNTYIALPHVSVCKSSNDQKAQMSDIQLVARTGWLRIYDEHKDIEWDNLNFRLEEHADMFNDAMTSSSDGETKTIEAQLSYQLNDFEDFEENGRNCYLPFETILFLLTAGNYVDLPTECLLEISNSASADDMKIIKFETPFPARYCGWHTKQQVVEQAFSAFLSKEGRSRWLHVNNKKVAEEILQTNEIYAVPDNAIKFEPKTFESYLQKHQFIFSTKLKEEIIKRNKALIKWYLQVPESAEKLKILTTISLPPTLEDRKAELYHTHETLKLEYKYQFGCELLTKYELLCVWLKMRFMKGIARTTNFGYCYRLSSADCDLHMKERLTLEIVEYQLKNYYHVNPEQLMANLAEFLQMLFNMPCGKYMLRYNPKYKDKLLLCAPSREITQNTTHLHSLFQCEPTDLLFMMQPQYLPILENHCSRVHLRYRILPCAFLPKLPHQKNLQTAETRAKVQNLFLERQRAAQEWAEKEKQDLARKISSKRRKQKRWERGKKKRDAEQKKREQETETRKLLEF